MADHTGQKMTGPASPVVVSSASSISTGPLPSPGASRRNSPSDQNTNATQADPSMSTQLAHPPPAPTPTAPAAPATPLTPATPIASGAASALGQHSNAAAQMHPSVQTVRPQMPSSTMAQVHRPPINGFGPPPMQPQQGQRQRVAYPSPRFNTAIHKAHQPTLTQAIADFGSRLVQTSKRQLISHFTAEDLDEVADEILSKASTNFLDQALARRLETIRARSLVNALAKAERLGYDVKDAVEERKDGTEHVIPYMKHDLAQHPSQHEQPQVCYGNFRTIDRVGREICPHCGSYFSTGGLPYHIKSQACGKYTERDASALMPSLQRFYQEHVSAGPSGAAQGPRLMPSSTPDQSRRQPAQSSAPSTHFTAVNSGTAATMTPRSASTTGKGSGPYAHLSPEDRDRLKEELAHTEAHYGALLRKAMQLPQPQQDEEVAKIKNCFNTKQSTTRRKYGVKLRERRTKAEIEAERERLITAPPEENLGRRQDVSASQNGSEPVGKKARINERGDSAPTSQPAVSSPVTESPRKRVRLADMGGLGASAATAEHIDPTTAAAQDHSASQPQPAKESPGSNVVGATPDAQASTGARNDPMKLDDSTDTEDSDSEEEDGDIPAVLTKKM
ncbi:hypothetical protein MHUMG1_06425 [Metarhizium humberi]|uniref:Uncharacterized protein n=1 Tax=Metarhizium humberi TaxID=2596975 RepID=A0A9P8S5R2_9HYPO|nr:hypothetical protein MHUMG1_06425 [Metarhizium humberi]